MRIKKHIHIFMLLLSISLPIHINAESKTELNPDGFLAASYILNTHLMLIDLSNFCSKTTNNTSYIKSVKEWEIRNKDYMDATSGIIKNYLYFIRNNYGPHQSKLAQQKFRNKFTKEFNTEDTLSEYFTDTNDKEETIEECSDFKNNIIQGFHDINRQDLLPENIDAGLPEDLKKLMTMYKNKSYNKSLKQTD